MAENQDPISYKDFSKRIKEKYPEYKDVDDLVLSQKMVEKYPEYKETVIFEEVKKKDSSVSSATPLQLPKISEQVSPLQQGANIVGGGVIGDISKTVPKGSIKEAALADKKKNESYLGALWNNVVGSAARLAGGAARATYQFSGNPVVRMERELLDRAGKSMGKNFLAEKEKEYADAVKGVIERGRTSASSKEYEQKLSEGFDVTNGLGVSDLKGLGTMIPQFIADMGLAVGTGGTSFAIQGYDDALSMVDEVDKDRKMSEGTRLAFGLGGAVVISVLDKLGLDNLVKTPAAKKYVTAKVIKEATDELAKKGVKITAEQFENTVKQKASQLTRKELAKVVAKKGATSFGIEGGTEAAQEMGIDLLKVAANRIEDKEIFDEEEIKDTAAKRYLNSLVAGGALGFGGGAAVSTFQNTQAAIKDKLKNVKTVEDIDAIVGEINENVADGTMTEEEANDVLPIVQNFVEVSQKVPAELSGKNKVEAVDLITEREKVAEQLKQIEEQKAALDPAFHNLLDEDAKQLQEREKEINNELAELAKPENNVEEVKVEEEIQQPIEDKKDILNVENKKKPILDEVTDEKIGEKDYQDFSIEFSDGANAFGTIEDGVASISGINAPKNESGVIRGSKTYERLLGKLKEQGINTVQIKLQSKDSSIAIDKLLEKGVLINPRNMTGVSTDQRPTKFDIAQEIKKQPQEEVVTERVEVEPELPEGERISTISGMTESERLKNVEERRKSTQLKKEEIVANDLVDLTNRLGIARGNEKVNLSGEIRQRVRKLNDELGYEAYKFNGVTVSKKSPKGKKYTKLTRSSKDISGRAIKEDAVLLTDRDGEFVAEFEKIADSPNIESLEVDAGNGKRMSTEQVQSAFQDIIDGIPSVQADNLLNVLEEGYKRGYFDLVDRNTYQRVQAPYQEFLGVEVEEATQPMTEEDLLAYLDEESKLTPEQENELENLENLINEYESQPQKAVIEREVSKTEPTAEVGSPKPTQPNEKGKADGEPKADLSKEPIGEAKADKSPLEQEYEEANNKKGEKAKQKAKEKLISDNFDGIVAQLMTKNKIKRKC